MTIPFAYPANPERLPVRSVVSARIRVRELMTVLAACLRSRRTGPALCSILFCLCPNSEAFSAVAKPFLAVAVLAVVLVSLRAPIICQSTVGRNSGPDCNSGSRSDSAQDVFARCYRFEMRRIDATAHSAFVVDIKTIRDFTDERLVTGAVSRERTITGFSGWIAYFDASVTASVASSKPEPTAGKRLKRYIAQDSFLYAYSSHAVILLLSRRSGLLDAGHIVAARSYFSALEAA
jgi:hypothetical protein